MKSLTTRLLAGNGIVLAVFVVLTALAVSWSVHERADAAREDRMRGLVYGILGATEIETTAGVSGGIRLVVREGELPDRRLATPTAGLYAEIVGNDGMRLWQSRSSVDHVPPVQPTPIGEWLRERVESPDGTLVDRLQLQSVYELDDGQELPFIVQVVDPADDIAGQLRRFDRSLWLALSAAAIALLVVQLGVLFAALRPLSRLGEQLDEIDSGQRVLLDEQLPREIAPLARRVNAFVGREQTRHARYRHLLDDLAHTLKTPLSILRSLSDPRVDEPVARMQASIARYLQRAHTETTTLHANPVEVAEVARRVADGIGKLYASRDVRIEVAVPADFRLSVPEADLFEVLGNLVDNAVKFGASNVRVSATTVARRITVEDDGPGLGDADPERLLGRGVRADTSGGTSGGTSDGTSSGTSGGRSGAVEGQGMGLAAVAEMLDAWGGTIRLEPLDGGGTRVVVTV